MAIWNFLLPEPLINKDVPVLYKDNKPVVYSQRWLVLGAFCMGYFTWNFHGARATPLIAEYSLYYNQPNEIQAPPNFGIDFILIIDGFLLLALYPLAGMLIDNYGIPIMIYGTIGQALACWWWFLSFDRYFSVVFSKFLSNLSGACIASALLRISNNWFAEDQRALAVAIGALFATFGAGISIVFTPVFVVGDDIINPNLLSCNQDELIENGLELDNLPRLCNDIAEEAFCCASDTNIDGLNFFMAIFATLVAVFAFMVVQDAPPTPPSVSGAVRKGPKFTQALRMLFGKWNYCQLCVIDFVCSGPPIVLFRAVDRVFPPAVDDIAPYAATGAFIVAVPVGLYLSKRLAEKQEFYEMTAVGYIGGFICWLIATIFIFIDTETTDYLVISIGAISIVAYAVWSIAVYELKIEYVFSSEYAIQGYVVALDRTIINLASAVYLVAIPPERFKGDAMSGRQFTFLIGAFSMGLGALLAIFLPYKKRYLRKAFEESSDIKIDN